MPKKRKPAKSRLREKPARGPQPFSARYEGVTSKYLTEVAEQRTESKLQEMVPSLQPEGSIGRARSAVRQALKEELNEIDSLAKELLK